MSHPTPPADQDEPDVTAPPGPGSPYRPGPSDQPGTGPAPRSDAGSPPAWPGAADQAGAGSPYQPGTGFQSRPPVPYGAAPAAGSTGAIAWWLGLLLLTGVPVVSNLLALVAVGVARAATPRSAGFARESTRRAVNLHLTLTLGTVAVCGGYVALLWALTRDEPWTTFPWPALILLLVPALGVYGVVASIAGGIRAGRHELPRARLAVPFLRPDRG